MAIDSPALAGRLRRTTAERRSIYERRAVERVYKRAVMDVRPPAATKALPPAKKVSVRVAASETPSVRTMRSAVLRRELVQAQKRKAARRRRMMGNLRGKLLTAAAVFLCILGVGVGISGLRTNHKVEAQVQHLTQQSQAQSSPSGDPTPPAPVDIPSESKPPASAPAYQAPPDHPKEIKIPKLKVDAHIIPVGILKSGDLATPGNIFDTGWYSSSALPGQQGSMLVDGHVSGPTQHGVFYGIKNLQSGDTITVVRGDGKSYDYTVVTTKVYDANSVDMQAAVTPITQGKAGLNLITCTGKLDSTDTHFMQRVVVFASLNY